MKQGIRGTLPKHCWQGRCKGRARCCCLQCHRALGPSYAALQSVVLCWLAWRCWNRPEQSVAADVHVTPKSSYGLGLFGNGAIKHTQSCNNRLHNMLISRNYILFSLFRHGNIIQQRLQYICCDLGQTLHERSQSKVNVIGGVGESGPFNMLFNNNMWYNMLYYKCYITIGSSDFRLQTEVRRQESEVRSQNSLF